MKADQDALMAKALKGQLNSSEAAEWQEILRTDRQVAARFDEEKSLDRLLNNLPDMALSSNFTALTVQAALREARQSHSSIERRPSLWRRWIQLGLGGAMACVGLAFILHQQQMNSQKELVESIRSVSEVATLPQQTTEAGELASVEVWQNFDAIYRMEQMPQQEDVDQVLLVALEK